MRKPLNVAVIALAGAGLAAASTGVARPAVTSVGEYSAVSKPNCLGTRIMCVEVQDPASAFGTDKYVGHDEPATEFYSNFEGSGNNTRYQLSLPVDPKGAYSNSKSYNFELHPAFWFGMAMCDTTSYPEQKSTCTPDSDTNIVDPTKTTSAAGVAFEELQFYPPGWVPQFAGSSCDATKWCVALNIDSLMEDPIAGTTQNSTCQGQVLGGVEDVNFAFLTLNGTPIGPPNPKDFNPNPSTPGNPSSGDPQGNSNVFFAGSGDQLTVTLHDSANGLVTTVADATTGQTGKMTASAANHFGHIVYDPTGSTCVEQDYNFHPMYSTSSPQTRVLWAAHTYNVAFSDEIGHFDFCTHLDADQGGVCNGLEGPPGHQEPAELTSNPAFDDNGCFPAEESLKYPATGCAGTNAPGFDGAAYYASRWPNGSKSNTTSLWFSSARTGDEYEHTYPQIGFETDLPRIEASDLGGACVRTTGAGCTNPPPNDDGASVFYPYFSTATHNFGDGKTCAFGLGATLPDTINNFGGSSTSEYGSLLFSNYYHFGGGGSTVNETNDFRQILSNPCP